MDILQSCYVLSLACHRQATILARSGYAVGHDAPSDYVVTDGESVLVEAQVVIHIPAHRAGD